MPETRKVLGQLSPAAATLSTLYTVPAGTQAVSSTILVANQNVMGTRFRVSVAISGAVDATQQYIYRDVMLAGRSTFAATIGITLGPGDVVRVYADDANVSFNLFGVEIT